VLGDSKITRGDVFLLRPGAWHGYAEASELSLYNCCFDAALLGRELSWMADDPLLGQLLWGLPLSANQGGMVALHLSDLEFTRCCKLLDEMEAFGNEDYSSRYGDHLGLLIQVFSLLARNLAAATGRKPAKPHSAVATALKLIDEAPTEGWTLQILASRVHVESTYFVHLFRSVVGLPPMAYVNRRRLELATKLLRQDDLVVGEVGAMSGWADANYFSRCFRKHFGMTPSKYRARFMTAKTVHPRSKK
jgi:AraC family L-rhamnose operon transcriptional activator RhaR